VHKKEPKSLSLDTFYGFKIYLNAFAAGALLRTTLGNITLLPKSPSSIWVFLQGRDGRAESGVYHYSRSQHTEQYHTI